MQEQRRREEKEVERNKLNELKEEAQPASKTGIATKNNSSAVPLIETFRVWV